MRRGAFKAVCSELPWLAWEGGGCGAASDLVLLSDHGRVSICQGLPPCEGCQALGQVSCSAQILELRPLSQNHHCIAALTHEKERIAAFVFPGPRLGKSLRLPANRRDMLESRMPDSVIRTTSLRIRTVTNRLFLLLLPFSFLSSQLSLTTSPLFLFLFLFFLFFLILFIFSSLSLIVFPLSLSLFTLLILLLLFYS